jgi:hypothetical protein
MGQRPVNAETRERLIEAGARAIAVQRFLVAWAELRPYEQNLCRERAAVVLDAFLEAGFGEGE